MELDILNMEKNIIILKTIIIAMFTYYTNFKITNKKVDVTYIDFDDKTQDKTSDISPKLKLTEPKPVVSLPKAGLNTFLFTFVILTTGFLVFSATKLTLINRKMK